MAADLCGVRSSWMRCQPVWKAISCFFLFFRLLISSVIVPINLPATELCQQPPGDASMHDHAAALVLDPFHLARLVEERNQCALLVGKPHVDGCIVFVQLF